MGPFFVLSPACVMFKITRRSIFFVVTSLVAAYSILYMQGRFEASDVRHAKSITMNYRSKQGVSIPDALSHRHPGKGIQWGASLHSSCFQHIRVHASVNDDPSKPPRVYLFMVDLNGPTIHPGNKDGKELLDMLNRPLPKPAASPEAGKTPSVVPGGSASAAPALPSASSSASASAVPSALPSASASSRPALPR